jgi:hypothetical protein
MPVFFNGRLLISPTVASMVDDSAMANRNLATGNILALIGTSEGGAPNTALRFGSPQEARAVLRSGTLLTACEKAFDPSADTNAPATVVAVRVNPAEQADLALTASSATVLTLASTDYGLWTNQIKARVESGTNKGKRLTTQVGNDYYTQDDVYRDALSVVYTGAEATATITVSNSTVVLKAPAATTVATIDLATYPTVRQLVDRINALAGTGWLATVLDGNDEQPALNGLDSVTAQSVKTTAYTVTGNLQAVVDWFNGAGEGYITATREAGAGTVPDNMAWTYLAGGTDGTVTSDEWADAFETLQAEDVQWVVPLTSDASIHAQADAHCAYMAGVARMERRCFVGGAAAQTIAEVIAAAKLINSDRTAQVYPGYYDYNASGVLTLYPSYMSAVLIAAGFAGSNPGTAMTNKSFKARGLEAKLRNPTDTDGLIQAGVLCLEDTPTGYRCVKSVSTWLKNLNYNRVEVSVGYATDYTARTVRDALRRYIGEKGSPLTLALAGATTETALRELARPEPAGPGILVGDAESPAYKNITVALEGDVMRVEFQCSPVIPINYIPITIHIVPYSGTVTAAVAA